MLKDVAVGKSKVGKLGAFAKRKFNGRELIIKIVPGRVIHRKELKYTTKESERWDYYDGNHYYFMGDPEYYINHSCDPNAFIKNFGVYALKPIKKGEEIFFDYSLGGIDSWKMKCKCGARRCRKIIDGLFFNLPKKLQKGYLSYLPAWFKKAFKKKLEGLN